MSKEYRLEFDGQSVTQSDYNSFASAAAREGEYILSELFRLTPNSGAVARGIVPSSNGLTLIAPAGATGTVKVNPFRAIIGSRVVAGTDAALNWQDARSGISVADGATVLATTVSLFANATGNSRWDAIYAIVTLSNPSTPVTRKVKDPGSAVVTDESVSPYSSTTVTVSKVTGTASATPVFPSIPADSGDIYYILLGYVRVPTGFTAGSTVLPKDVNTVATVISLSAVTGVSGLKPANQHYVSGGTAISGTGTSPTNGVLKWTGTAASRPGLYIPPTMVGSESRIIAIDLLDASSTNWSHQNSAILDDSVDWRNRVFKWSAKVALGTGSGAERFPWATPGSGNQLLDGANTIPSPGLTDLGGTRTVAIGFGQSYGTTPISGAYTVAWFQEETDGSNVANVPGAMAPSSIVQVYVDSGDGSLRLAAPGTPLCAIFLWLDATAPYENR